MDENELIGSARTGLKLEADSFARYEVHRERESGAIRKADRDPKAPLVEEFLALDRARVAALGYALDGPSQKGGLTGVVRIVQKIYRLSGHARKEHRVVSEAVVDVIDERVAFRLLNEVRLPRADELAVSQAQLQGEVDELLRSLGR